MTTLPPMPPQDVQACLAKMAVVETHVEELRRLPRRPENRPVLLAGLKEVERIMAEVCGLLEGRWIN